MSEGLGANSGQAVYASRTTTSLLDALQDHANEPAWGHIDRRYRPVIIGLVCRMGLDRTEAEDVAQASMTEFVRAYRAGKYDRSKGRLSSWVLGIARHQTLRVFRSRVKEGNVDPLQEQTIPDGAPLRELWEHERDRAIFHDALATLRDDQSIARATLDAFELTAVRGLSAKSAAQQCGLSTDQVYVARSRVTKKLRELVAQMTGAFEEDT